MVAKVASRSNIFTALRLHAFPVISILTVTVIAGILFSQSARLSHESLPAGESNLISLIRHKQMKVQEESQLNLKNAHEIREKIIALQSGGLAQSEKKDLIDLRAVKGPGLRVTLNDAPSDPIPEGAQPDDLVIHQQDIDDVMNALWRGGAEAMSVQGIRIASGAVIRCIGNVILINGQSFSPPYKIEAIGEPAAMTRELNSDPRIINYKEYVARYGLGWNLSTSDELRLSSVS